MAEAQHAVALKTVSSATNELTPLARSAAHDSRLPTPSGPRFLSQLGALLWKDLVTEWRRRELLTSLAVFSLLVLLVFDFAFDLRSAEAPAAAPGILWVTFIFAGMLNLNRAFAIETDRGTWEGLLLAPIDRSAIYLAKLLASFAFMLAVEVLSLAAFAAFFNVPADLPRLVAAVLAGTLGFATVGTLFAAMAATTQAREIFLPVLLLPISVPVIIGAVKATGQAFSGAPAGDYPWLGLVLAFDAIFLAVSFALFEFVIED
ncbi:MAG TPA: heme exporter protein CcmB [Chloroflexota bacterium]|nr:heme exporter protein CcmB [Chloroflexota bacterium]